MNTLMGIERALEPSLGKISRSRAEERGDINLGLQFLPCRRFLAYTAYKLGSAPATTRPITKEPTTLKRKPPLGRVAGAAECLGLV